MNISTLSSSLIIDPRNKEVLDVSGLQSVLRNSLKDEQCVTFETTERGEIPYIFKGEKLLHKEAK